ncbi:MAG: O-antigen ligase family protein [Gammaproteobacteria bacterium]|tara:strand:+ start:4354 stop:5610 length:1257 start_codon:yes stop_codon:yes gene_type:complete
MPNTIISIEKINIYLLPLAAFFILISTAATNFFLILTVFSAFILCIKDNSFDEIFRNDFFFKICFLIFFLFVISSSYTIAEPNETLNSLKKYIKIIYIPFLFYYLKTFKNHDLVLKYFLIGATFILVLSYVKYFFFINMENFYKDIKFLNISVNIDIIETRSSVFQNRIIQGVALSFYSFLCLYYAKKNNNLILYFLSILAFINIIFMSDSRTAYILITFLFAFSFFKIITNNKFRLFFLSLIILLMTTNFSNNLEHRINLTKNNIKQIQDENYNSSIGMRYIWLKVGVQNFLDEPILGNGVGSFYKLIENYLDKKNIKYVNGNSEIGSSEGISSNPLVTNNPHSEFVSISVQLGILGLLSFFIFLYLLFINCNSPMSVATFIVVLISSLFNSAFYDNMLGLFLIILISLFYKNKVKN